jgi:streptomycin 6-kinase
VTLPIPARLVENCAKVQERGLWLERLPHVVRDLERRWHLTLGPPFDGDGMVIAWVAPARLPSGTPAVLKVGMPHMEADHELHGMRFWNGDPTARLIDADDDSGAMLLERCEPGTSLRELPEPDQDVVIAQLLRRLWRMPPAHSPFRPLSAMTDYWSEMALADAARWPDADLVRDGLHLFTELSRNATTTALLATDLHAGNVLRAERKPWLVIDPKPFVGDTAYDATQHLLNCRGRLRSDPAGTIGRFADLLDVDRERVRLWTFARLAAEPWEEWTGESLKLARAVSR